MKATRFFRVLCLGTLLVSGCLTAYSKQWLVYFGTYTSGDSKGIYVSRFDGDSGKLSAPELATETKNPSFLALNSNGSRLYSVSEVSQAQGKPSGAASAFSIASDTGKLSLINQQLAGGSSPCHLALDGSGTALFVANYGVGSVATMPVGDDGSLGAATVLQHLGSSVNPKRQAGPHAHQAVVSPDNRFLLVCDLGLDKVMVYKINPAGGKLEPNDPPSVGVKPGAGPRHLAFRPDGRFIYVINELDSTMTVFGWDAQAGVCRETQTLSTLPDGFTGTNYCAEVVTHPTGRFVYGSNRGHDSIAVFESDAGSGRLAPLGHTSSGGGFPRNIALDPDGKWLLSLNQNSGNIVVLAVDASSGKLRGPVSEAKLGSPVCAVFVKAP
jgi:6-phosphogluconolactonase